MDKQEAQELTRILKEEKDLAKVSYNLTNYHLGTIPVAGIRARDKSREKHPVLGYSSTNFLSYDDDDISLHEEVFYDPRVGGIAICPTHESSLLIVDVDTPEESEFFHTWLTLKTKDPMMCLLKPTVITPGIKNDGVAIHYGGGHYYFALPDGALDKIKNIRASRTIKDEDSKDDTPASFLIRSQGGYLITAPTERTEGTYECTGQIIFTDDYEGLTEAFIALMDRDTPSNRRTPKHRDSVYLPSSMTENSRASKIEEWTKQNSPYWEGLLDVIDIGPATCGGADCRAFKYDRATGSLSGTRHKGCSYGDDTFTIFSETMKADYDVYDLDNSTFRLWTLYINKKYNGDMDNAVIGEGFYNSAYSLK